MKVALILFVLGALGIPQNPGIEERWAELQAARERRVAPSEEIPLSYVVGKYHREPVEIAYLSQNDKAYDREITLELTSKKTFTLVGETRKKLTGTFTFDGKGARMKMTFLAIDGVKRKEQEVQICDVRTNGSEKYLKLRMEEVDLWFEKAAPKGSRSDDVEVIGKLGQAMEDCKFYTSMNEKSKVVSSAKAFQFLVVKDAGSSKWKKVLLVDGRYGYVKADQIAVLPYVVTVPAGGGDAAPSGGESPRDDSARFRPSQTIPLSYVTGRYRTERATLERILTNPSADEIEKFSTKVRLNSDKTFTLEAYGTKWTGSFTFNGEEARLFFSITHRNGKRGTREEILPVFVMTNGAKKYLHIPDLDMWVEKY